MNTRIRIWSLNAAPDTGPVTQFNADPCGSGSATRDVPLGISQNFFLCLYTVYSASSTVRTIPLQQYIPVFVTVGAQSIARTKYSAPAFHLCYNEKNRNFENFCLERLRRRSLQGDSLKKQCIFAFKIVK